MKELYIDIGNTDIKALSLSEGKWGEVQRYSNDHEFKNWIDVYGDQYDRIIVSSVVAEKRAKLIHLIEHADVIEITSEDIPVSRLYYETPKTLGIDRFLTCLGAYAQAEGNSVIVVDAGTACTIDIMDKEGVFQGGVIMPGIEAIQEAFKLATPELPIVDLNVPEAFPGKSTKTSIQWGMAGMVNGALNLYMQHARASCSDCKLFVTGGSGEEIQGLLPEASTYDTILIFKGMKLFLDLFVNQSQNHG